MMYSLSSKKVSIRAIISYLWNSFKNWKPLVGQQIKEALDSWTIFSRHDIRNSFSQIVFKRLAYNWPSILECETNTTSITQKHLIDPIAKQCKLLRYPDVKNGVSTKYVYTWRKAGRACVSGPSARSRNLNQKFTSRSNPSNSFRQIYVG